MNGKTACVLNFCLFGLELLATVWMISGFSLFGESAPLADSRWKALKYFTVDSNILMGLIALYTGIRQALCLAGKGRAPGSVTYALKLAGTVGVVLTMLVTVFFLAPTMSREHGWFGLFLDSNFLFHLLNPLLAAVIFVFFEKTEQAGFPLCFAGLVPMVLYAVYYGIEVFSHVEDGKIMKGYDWYGFFIGGPKSVVAVVPAILLVTFLISLGLWAWNRAGLRG